MIAEGWSAGRGVIAAVVVGVMSVWSAGCDRTRLLEDGESATETQPVVTAEDFAGEWRIVETASNDAGQDVEPLGHASETGWVTLTPVASTDEPANGDVAEDDDESGDDAGSQPPARSELTAELCDERGCQQPLERVTLERQDDEWRMRYGIAQPGSGPRVANVCAMRVVTWVMRPVETDTSAGGIQRITLSVTEVRGELTLEGEARCRGADAVENVDRLTDAELSRLWTLQRVEANGETSESNGDETVQ